MSKKICLLAALLCALSAFGQSVDPAVAADALYQAKEWSKAAEAYAAIAEADPTRAQAWFRLGASRHHLGEYKAALEAYDKAATAGFFPAFVAYNRAASYARLGDKDRALAQLEGIAPSGMFDGPAFEQDADFAALAGEARFQSVIKTASKASHPCHEGRYRDLDFWIGDWVVQNHQGVQVGTSKVELTLDRCVILENWSNSRGGGGKSFNIYNGATGKWHQTWVSDKGWLTEFTGGLEGGSMKYVTDSADPSGTPRHREMTFTPLPDGRVRQFSRNTTDGGKTWNVDYDFYYSRASQ